MHRNIFLKHKEEFNGIALIDDRPEIKNIDQAVWQHIVFGQPYNQHIDTPFRLENWDDERLPTLLAVQSNVLNSLFSSIFRQGVS